MCGIFAYLGKSYKKEELTEFLLNNKHRGPDNTQYFYLNDELYLGFNRLMINGINKESNQPFLIKNNYLICNGEIYNFKDLIKKYNL